MQEINLPTLSTIQETDRKGTFSIEPLFPGYGSTLGNALRRVLLSSLEGAAVDYVEIDGVQHEFSAIPHVKEDVIRILINLKTLRFKLVTETAELTLTVKGSRSITGADFAPNSDCQVINTDQVIATMEAEGSMTMRIGVKRGRGYEPVEKKEDRSKAVGVITTDSIYSPVVAVSYNVENTRVGQMTNYDRLVLEIQTDGTIMPSFALKTAAAILTEQYRAIADLPAMETSVEPDEEEDDFEPSETIVVKEGELDILHTMDPKTRVEDAGLSGRTAHALVAAGYKTLSGLKRLSEIKLQSIKGLGAKGVEEVKAVLSRVE